MTSAHITTHEHKPAASPPSSRTARPLTAERPVERSVERAERPSDARNTPHTQTRRRLASRGAAPASRPHRHTPRGPSMQRTPPGKRVSPCWPLPPIPAGSRPPGSWPGAVAACAVPCALHPRDTPRRSDPTERGQRTHACRPCMLTRERGREKGRAEHQASVRCCRGSSHCHAPGIGFSWAMALSKMRPLGSLRRMRSLDQRSSIYTAVVGVC